MTATGAGSGEATGEATGAGSGQATGHSAEATGGSSRTQTTRSILQLSLEQLDSQQP